MNSVAVKAILLFFSCSSMLVLGHISVAQETIAAERESIDERIARLEGLSQETVQVGNTESLSEPSGAIQAARLAAQVNYLEYEAFRSSHTRRLHEWQLFSGKIIFVVAMGAVVFGFVLSYMQFKQQVDYFAGQLDRAELNPQEEPTDGESTGHELPYGDNKLSGGAGKFELSASSIGIVILGLSLAFLYLYIAFVHPINFSD